MESIINKGVSESPTPEEISKTEEALQQVDAKVDAKNEAVKDVSKKPTHQVIRVDVPVDQMLNASRPQRKLFFKTLEKQIKARLEIVRLERQMAQTEKEAQDGITSES